MSTIDEQLDQIADKAADKIAQELVDNNVVNMEDAKDQVDPLDQAAYIFQNALPRIKALSSNMSRNALSRVYRAVAEYPLADNYPTFRTKAETELFIVTLSANAAKSTMLNAFMPKTPEAQKEMVDTITDGIVTEMLHEMVDSKEENNGQ